MKENSGQFDFESLELYKKSLEYIDFVYGIIIKFPREELFGLTSQFRNAANSIAMNTGEGYRESIPIALRYLKISRGLIRECLVCSTIAHRRKYMDDNYYFESRRRHTELSKLSAGYKKYLDSKK